MRFLVFGSANIDHVYHLPRHVRPGETLASDQYQRNEGGKGLNQAIALAKAGQETYFAGAIGEDGIFLRDYLRDHHVHTEYLHILPVPTGHALIQVDERGENAIVLFGGANQQISPDMIEETLSQFEAGDYLLMQNEVSGGERLIRAAFRRGMRVILNPSPMSAEIKAWPLEQVDWLILNEIEGGDLTGQAEPDAMLDALLSRCPDCHIVLTLGEKGSIYADKTRRVFQERIPCRAVDTTAAGDTFTGYFFQAVAAGETVEQALAIAARAAAIAVSRPGASRSIPWREEVLA